MKRFRQILSVFFSPYSPGITLVLGFFINIITSTSSENRPKFIENLYQADNITNILIIIGLWFIASFSYTIVSNRYSSYEKEILTLKENIQNKERQIEQNSGIIFHKYGELAKYSKSQYFYEVLKSFVDSNSLIHSAQLYRYSSKIENGNLVKFKVTYEQGYTYESVETNSILQSYFIVELKLYKQISSLVEIWKILSNQEENQTQAIDECLSNELIKLPKLLNDIIKELNKINNTNECNELHYSMYRIALIILKMIYSKEGGGIEALKLLSSEVLEDYLVNTKRTGILGAILLKDTYIFKHIGDSSKNGRMYVTFDFKIYNEDYILLMAIPPNELSDEIRWDKELQRLKNDFIIRMDSTNS